MKTPTKGTEIVLARITGHRYPPLHIENELLSSYFRKGTAVPLSGVIYLCSDLSSITSKRCHFSNECDINVIFPYLVLSWNVGHNEGFVNTSEMNIFMGEPKVHIDKAFKFLLKQNKSFAMDEINQKDLSDRIFCSGFNKNSEEILNHINDTLALHSKISASSFNNLQSSICEWIHQKICEELALEMNDRCLLLNGHHLSNQAISNVIQHCTAVSGVGLIVIESQFLLGSENFIKQFELYSKTPFTEMYLYHQPVYAEYFETCSPLLIYIENIDIILEKFSDGNDIAQSSYLVDIFLDNLYKLIQALPKVCFIAANSPQSTIPTKLLAFFVHLKQDTHDFEINYSTHIGNFVKNYIALNNWHVSSPVLNQLNAFAIEQCVNIEDVENFLNEINVLTMKVVERSGAVHFSHCDQSRVVSPRIVDAVSSKLLHTMKLSSSRCCNSSQAKNLPTRQKISQVFWEDIGGLESVRKEILDMIDLPLKYHHLFPAESPRRHGILLYGPPGTGKTLVAKAVATECNMNFLSIKGPELLEAYVGESEKNIRDLFSNAMSQSPCILFFDEIDSIAPSRAKGQDSGGGVMDRIVSQLLTEIDRLSSVSNLVFVIAATNRPDLLDAALLRPGRFDRRIFLGSSTSLEAKISVLKAQTRMFHLAKNFNFDDIAKSLPEQVTGADIGSICSSAYTKALRRKLDEINLSIQPSFVNDADTMEGPQSADRDRYLQNLSKRELNVILNSDDFIQAANELIPTQYDHKYYDAIEKMYSSRENNFPSLIE